MLLFLNSVIQKQSGNEEKALAHLDEILPKAKDLTAWKVFRGIFPYFLLVISISNYPSHIAQLLLDLKKRDLASAAYLELIDINPDNIEYLQGLVKAKQGAGDENYTELVQIFRYYLKMSSF